MKSEVVKCRSCIPKECFDKTNSVRSPRVIAAQGRGTSAPYCVSNALCLVSAVLLGCEPSPGFGKHPGQRRLVCRRHHMDAGNPSRCGERLDELGADALAFRSRIHGALQPLYKGVRND